MSVCLLIVGISLFCLSLLNSSLFLPPVRAKGFRCPVCSELYGRLEGAQPSGTMQVTFQPSYQITGRPRGEGAIMIEYDIPDGTLDHRAHRSPQSSSASSSVFHCPSHISFHHVCPSYHIKQAPPATRFTGTKRVAYLPATQRVRDILRLGLVPAFQQGLIFKASFFFMFFLESTHHTNSPHMHRSALRKPPNWPTLSSGVQSIIEHE